MLLSKMNVNQMMQCDRKIQLEQVMQVQEVRSQDPKSVDIKGKFKDMLSLIDVDFGKFDWSEDEVIKTKISLASGNEREAYI